MDKIIAEHFNINPKLGLTQMMTIELLNKSQGLTILRNHVTHNT